MAGHIAALKIVSTQYQLQTNDTNPYLFKVRAKIKGIYMARTRVEGGEGGVLNEYRKVKIGYVESFQNQGN